MQILRINKEGNKLNESIHIKEQEEKIIEKKIIPKAQDAPSQAPTATAAASWCYNDGSGCTYLLFVDNY